MSVAGKKLQDIYDAGAAKLTDMDRSQRSVMAKSVDTSQSASETVVAESAAQLEQRSKECQSDIQSTLTKTVQQIQKTIDSESLATENRLTVLKDNIAALSKKLHDSIAELRVSHEARLDVVSEDVANLCAREFDNAAAELHIQDYSSSKTLKVQNTFVMNSFQQRLDHGLLETRGEEKQINNKISKSFLQSVNTIDTHVSNWIGKLSQSFEDHSQSLERLFKDGDAALEEGMTKLAADVDNHAEEIEQKIDEYFEHVSYDFKEKGEKQSGDLLDELKGVNKSASEDVSKLTRELAGELEAASEASVARLKQTSADLKGKVDSSLDAVNKECNKRREMSLSLKQELEARARELIENIKGELSDLHASFEQRLKTQLSGSAQELSSICAQAESAIAEAQSSCEGQFKSLADKAKDQIQSKLSELLLRIKKQQDVALDEVMKVATGAAQDSAERQNPAPKRTKRKKNSAAPEENQAQDGDR